MQWVSFSSVQIVYFRNLTTMFKKKEKCFTEFVNCNWIGSKPYATQIPRSHCLKSRPQIVLRFRIRMWIIWNAPLLCDGLSFGSIVDPNNRRQKKSTPQTLLQACKHWGINSMTDDAFILQKCNELGSTTRNFFRYMGTFAMRNITPNTEDLPLLVSPCFLKEIPAVCRHDGSERFTPEKSEKPQSSFQRSNSNPSTCEPISNVLCHCKQRKTRKFVDRSFLSGGKHRDSPAISIDRCFALYDPNIVKLQNGVSRRNAIMAKSGAKSVPNRCLEIPSTWSPILVENSTTQHFAAYAPKRKTP